MIYINLWRFLIPTHTPSVALSNLIYIQGRKPILEPQNDQKDTPKFYAFPPCTFEKKLKSCCGSPNFLSKLNLPIHSISSTSREAMPHICDPRGPSQWPKKIKIDAFSSEPLQNGKYDVKAAINSYPDLISSTCMEAIPHIWDPRPPVTAPNCPKTLPK